MSSFFGGCWQEISFLNFFHKFLAIVLHVVPLSAKDDASKSIMSLIYCLEYGKLVVTDLTS